MIFKLTVVIAGDDGLAVNSYEPDEYNQRWKIQADKICHQEDEETVLDLADCCEDEGAKVCSYGFNGGDNQKWSIEHV